VWSRQLLVLVGGSLDAAAAVLASFMLGLALGSLVLGRRAEYSSRAPGLLRVVLVASGVLAFLPYFLSGPALRIYPAIYGEGAAGYPARLLLSLLMLFPATFFAGGIIPVMARLTEGIRGSSSRETGRLYGFHTLGSAAGGMITGFLLLEILGALAALSAGSLVLILSSLLVPGGKAFASVATRTCKSRRPCGRSPLAFFLIIYGLSGMLALGYEMVWTRQLTFVLGNSTYAFALMGSVVLAGLGLGSLLGQIAGARVSNPLALFGYTEIALGIASVLPLASLGAFQAMSGSLGGRTSPWEIRTLAQLGVALLFMLPSTVCMGATFPLIVRSAARENRMGEDVGRLSMANSLGAAIGPLLASQLLFRLFGVTPSVALLAGGSILLGMVVLLRCRSFVASPLVAAASLGVVILTVGGSARPGSAVPFEDGELLFFREGRAATVAVFGREWDGHRSLRINGVEEVPIDQASLEAFHLLGHLPFAYNPDASSSMVIALGGGITAGSILSHPVDTLVCVELCPALVDASVHFEEENGRPDLDPRFHLVWDDGRNFVAAASPEWDIVVCDATHPGSVDSWVLYTSEFYEAMRAALANGGVAAQWVPLHQLPVEELRRILATWSRVFEHCAVHLAGGRHVILIGSADSISMELDRLFDTQSARSQLESVALTGADHEYLRPALVTEHLEGLRDGELGSNSDDLAPCQFLRRRVPADPQATISGNVAAILSLNSASSSTLREAQMLYWDKSLPEAIEMLASPVVESPCASRWLSVCLTTASESVLASGDVDGAMLLARRAVSEDSTYRRAASLLERIRSISSVSGS
jgi:spermidine synthase